MTMKEAQNSDLDKEVRRCGHYNVKVTTGPTKIFDTPIAEVVPVIEVVLVT